MKVFITGATGWIGSAVTAELLDNGYDVLGMARSDASADKLVAQGATPWQADLDDLGAIAAGANSADAVIHLANKHDFADMPGTNRAERAAVQTLVDTLAGSDRPLLVASGVAFPLGRPVTETDPSPSVGPDSARGGTERLALDSVDRGVRSIALRFAPTVHGEGDHGFISVIAGAARANGVSGYIGSGENRWAAVHRSDAATMVRLALEKAPAGSIVHGVAEEGVPTRMLAEILGEHLGLPVVSVDPEKAPGHFGWIAHFWGADAAATNQATRDLLGWTPSGPSLADDLIHY